MAAKYCSYETRKILDRLDDFGVTAEPFDIEIDIGTFWSTHVLQVVNQVMSGGDAAKKIEKIERDGWAYFRQPVRSMLTPRGAAHRSDGVVIHLDTRPTYNAISNGFARTDFNMTELSHIVEIHGMVRDTLDLSNHFRASGDNRSIYYLHGIVRREYQSRQGKIREIQARTDEGADRGWSVSPNYDKPDVVDRAELAQDWQDRLNNIKINAALNVPKA